MRRNSRQSRFNGIWISSFILITIITFFYIKIYEKKWKRTPVSVELTISGMDRLFQVGKFSHLKLCVAGRELELKDTSYNQFQILLVPGVYTFRLFGDSTFLQSDTFSYEGIKNLCYNVGDVRHIKGKLIFETDIENFWEL